MLLVVNRFVQLKYICCVRIRKGEEYKDPKMEEKLPSWRAGGRRQQRSDCFLHANPFADRSRLNTW